jgi:hypothetical protein
MSNPATTHASLPSTGKLLKATVIAAAVAAVLLVTTVMPAEYGIDPTGIGAKLGLTTLASIDAEDAETPDAAPAAESPAFGANVKQTFAAQALTPVVAAASPRSESMTVTLEPGKGVELKMLLDTGQGVVYRWSADADVAVDMHGERPSVKGPWTSYAIEAAQRSAAGTFIAPFDGTHGWYWENRGAAPVTVTVDVSGFQDALYQP